MKHLILLLIILGFACSIKTVPNYKVTPDGYIIWRYTKKGEPKKDILSNGDTLVTTKNNIYIISKVVWQTKVL